MKDTVKSANAFVKKEQMRQASEMGSRPTVERAMKKTDAYMNLNEMHSERLVDKLTRGLSKDYPVR